MEVLRVLRDNGAVIIFTRRSESIAYATADQ